MKQSKCQFDLDLWAVREFSTFTSVKECGSKVKICYLFCMCSYVHETIEGGKEFFAACVEEKAL